MCPLQVSAKTIKLTLTLFLVNENAEEALANVKEANEELDKAKEYQKGNGNIFATIFFVLGCTLWIWEFFNTIYIKQ